MSSHAEARRAKRDLSGSHNPASHIERFINHLVDGNLSPTAGRVILIVAVLLGGLFMILRDRRRRAHHPVAPSLGVTC